MAAKKKAVKAKAKTKFYIVVEADDLRGNVFLTMEDIIDNGIVRATQAMAQDCAEEGDYIFECFVEDIKLTKVKKSKSYSTAGSLDKIVKELENEDEDDEDEEF